MSFFTKPTFALESRNNKDSALSAEWWTICTVQYIVCTQTSHTHSISQYCRQELCCRFHYGFRLSREKVGSMNDDSPFSSITIHILWAYPYWCTLYSIHAEAARAGPYINCGRKWAWGRTWFLHDVCMVCALSCTSLPPPSIQQAVW